MNGMGKAADCVFFLGWLYGRGSIIHFHAFLHKKSPPQLTPTQKQLKWAGVGCARLPCLVPASGSPALKKLRRNNLAI